MLKQFWITLRRLLYHDKQQLAMMDTRYYQKDDTLPYTSFGDKPQINGVELNGNKTSEQLKVASLDSSGKVPVNQIPEYYDDVIEGYYSDNLFFKDPHHTQLITGQNGKIYIDLVTNLGYHFDAGDYVEMTSNMSMDLIGDMDDLETVEKTTLVGAINEAAKTGGSDISVHEDTLLVSKGGNVIVRGNALIFG